MVKNLPAKQERWVQSLVREDPLEKKMSTHCSILPVNPMVKEPGGCRFIVPDTLINPGLKVEWDLVPI